MNQEYLETFEQQIHQLTAKYLIGKGAIDNHLPEATDILERWDGICESYLPDGVREFEHYPTVSLGWMMFIGMAVAHMWDDDWEMYSEFKDLYAIVRDRRGYDYMDEYICQEMLKLSPSDEKKTSTLVGDTAEMIHTALRHEKFENGTPEAFNAYVRCLHQLYYFGAAVELKRLGYHMTRL